MDWDQIPSHLRPRRRFLGFRVQVAAQPYVSVPPHLAPQRKFIGIRINVPAKPSHKPPYKEPHIRICSTPPKNPERSTFPVSGDSVDIQDATYNPHSLREKNITGVLQKDQVNLKVVPKPVNANLVERSAGGSRNYTATTVKALRDNPHLGKYKVIARMHNYRPRSLEDCVIPWCRRCKSDILNPKRERACRACNDVDCKFVQLSYRWLLQLRDEDEGGLLVCVDDENPLFRDLKRVRLYEDDDAYDAFYARVKPIIGRSDDGKSERAPTLTFWIETCLDDSGEQMHFLLDYQAR
ncbi:hypothetical protein BDZ89DRAFT_1073162 [Hymenopellis radicata]|nr:hypothetical protein BDZ89DRAFT_1073162 [Hymenopellis radicata]